MRPISIHAPPRGATTKASTTAFVHTFQFTPLREGRLRVMPGGYTPGHFNSRPSARGDFDFFEASCTRPHFNSRPSARGDRRVKQRIFGGDVFQFTPLREGRPGIVTLRGITNDFNSRPSARGDEADVKPLLLGDKFQFTPLREGRLDARAEGTQNWCHFNSRPSARGDRM